MNKDQFIYWLKGFTKAVNEEGPTRGQWGIIASELNKIEDCPDYGSKIDNEPYEFGKSWVTTSTSYKVNLPKDNNQLELDLD
jgi:hypothetical protein